MEKHNVVIFTPEKGGCQVNFIYLAFIMKKLFINLSSCQFVMFTCFHILSIDNRNG